MLLFETFGGGAEDGLTAGKYSGAAQGNEEVVECCRGDYFVPPACQAGFFVANANPQMQDASMKPIPATVGAGLSVQACRGKPMRMLVSIGLDLLLA